MKRVYVGMSGGVDSSAAAYLLKEAGYDVCGITFVAAVETGTKKCCSLEEIEAARRVCRFLGIPHEVIDLKDVFEARVIQYFVASYEAGLVPNPCVMCNRYIKFGALLEEALARGADKVATGHYARVEAVEDGWGLFRGKDKLKDQSYFLSYVEREILPYVILPLGGMEKSEVRELVRRAGLPLSADKGESQDVCFVPGDYREYLRKRGVREREGEFVLDGRVIGHHRGVAFYSLGQRRGLGVAAGKRLYVREVDARNNRLVLGDAPQSRELWVGKVNVLVDDLKNGHYDVLLRYQSFLTGCEVSWEGERLHVVLDEPREIVTPGQFAVLYAGERVVASGMIEETRLLDAV